MGNKICESCGGEFPENKLKATTVVTDKVKGSGKE
jgi:RNA polymerase-binding transcription factor DksA